MTPPLSPPLQLSRRFRWFVPCALGGALVVLTALVAGVADDAVSPPPADHLPTCALPAGLDAAALTPHDRTRVASWQLLCVDFDQQRISAADYRARRLELDAALRGRTPVPGLVWASSVIGVSSEYSADQWSAREVLGAPDVFPSAGDHPHAWASRTADDTDEWIAVGYAQPVPIDAVEIYETYNPGAIDRVELTSVEGHTIAVYAGSAAAGTTAAGKRRIEFPCTVEAIASVRVHLDSAAVPGWNELDAIGVAPCR
jgi:hypothetical protein